MTDDSRTRTRVQPHRTTGEATALGPPWLPGPGGVVVERLVLECTVGGTGNPETFLAWVPGEFLAHPFDRRMVAASDVPYVRPTARFWWVLERVREPGGVLSRDGIAFERPGVMTAEAALTDAHGGEP